MPRDPDDMAASTAVYLFSPFQLDVRAAELRKHGVRLRLPRQSFEVLRMLVASPWQVVLRDEIRAQLWPNGTIVEFDQSINAAIKKLRTALSDSADDPRYIETVGRQGYRFIAEVEAVAAAPAVIPTLPIAAQLPPAAVSDSAAPLEHAFEPPPRYRIVGKLGEGAMGEVYLADDLDLPRQVALKVVSRSADASPSEWQRASARLRREAEAAATLTHPNICAVYSFEEFGGDPFIVMEYVEGETLAARLARGRLPFPQALRAAAQIAAGLGAAHRRGVVHRDVKPSNVILARTGAKVLDFGLAKIENPALTAHPSLTVPGAILGTPHYMSPEQVRGEEVDSRSDVFSFGIILYELIAGKKPFEGEHAASVAAAILEREAAPLEDAPPALDFLLRRCLAKDPAGRWQSAVDLQPHLEWIAEVQSNGPQSPAGPRSAWRYAAWAGVAALVLTTAAAWIGRRPPPVEKTQLTILPPANQEESWRGPVTLALSPDGRRLAYTFVSGANRQLWIRSISDPLPKLVPQAGATQPCWSPDGKAIAFFTNQGELQVSRLDDRTPVTLFVTGNPRGASWSSKGFIILAPSPRGPLWRIPESGAVTPDWLMSAIPLPKASRKQQPGDPVPATQLDEKRGEVTHRAPWFLPDGRHFLFTAATTAFPAGGVTIRLGTLDSLESTVLFEADSDAIYADGYILFIRGDVLMAQNFDQQRLTLAGDAIRVAEHVGVFSASQTGSIVFRDGAAFGTRQMFWLDRDGRRIKTLGDAGQLGQVRLSPDGSRAAVEVTTAGNTDIWIYETESGRNTRFTFDAGVDRDPVWSPDGRSIVFSSNRRGKFDLYRKETEESGPEELLYADALDKHPTSWSPDGRVLLYDAGGPDTDIWLLHIDATRSAPPKAAPFLKTPLPEGKAHFSADGHWIVYSSMSASGGGIYVVPFSTGAKPPSAIWQIPAEWGAGRPRWRQDGKEILFLSRYGEMMGAEVRTGDGTIRIEPPRRLFSPALAAGVGHMYDSSRDGQRFLLAMRPGESGAIPVTVIQNWRATLPKQDR